MIHHPCGADLPAYDIGGVVVHLAGCPHTGPELAAWCRAIVSAVSEAADIETPPVSPETPAVSPETPPPSHETPPVSRETPAVSTETPDETPRDTELLTPARMAELRDGGMSLRDIASLTNPRIGHETVRRLVARYRAGMEGAS